MAHDLIIEKTVQATRLLREFGIDCWITFARETALNGDPILDYFVPADLTWHSAILFTSSGSRIAIVGKYDRAMVEETGAYDRVVDYVQGIRAPFLEELRTIDPRTIAVNYSTDSEVCDGITHGMFLVLMDILAEAGCADRVVSAERLVSALRERKTAAERASIQEAVRQTEEIYDAVAALIRPGMSEAAIAGLMRTEMERRHLSPAWDAQTCPAVFTGPDTAGAHYSPTQRRVAPGHVLNMDFGVRVNGYVSDLQRSYYILRPGETVAPASVQHGFDTIRGAIEEARGAMRGGVDGLSIDKRARDHISNAGYEEFPHALGHQVGRLAHDGTALLGPAWEKYGRKPFVTLEPDMVFTIEPRLTVAGYGTVTIEEMVRVTETGAEYISRPQTSLRLIGEKT
jgi:Xaa-Pro aminopeptidase